MELAKIRKKAVQAEELSDAAYSKPEAQVLQYEPANEENPYATKLPVSAISPAITEEERTAANGLAQSTNKPVTALKTTKTEFDPLARILAGRAAMQTASLQKQKHDADLAENIKFNEQYEEFLCFTLAGEEYGINIMEIKEIIKVRELTEVPHTPDFIDGILSLRGVIVPVINMRKRMEMPVADSAPQQRIIIVHNGENLTGLRVDRITGVARIAENCREATPGVLDGTARDFVSGIGRYDTSMLILLDITTVVDFSFSEVLNHGKQSE